MRRSAIIPVLLYRVIAIIVACCAVIPVQAQLRLSAAVAPNPASICLNELVEYRIILENSQEKPDLRPPRFSNFMVIGSPATEEGVSSVNGKVNRYMAWVFTLKPRKKGVFRIEPTKAMIGGRPYETGMVTIEVKDCQSQPGNQSGQAYASGGQPGARESLQDMILKTGEDPEVKAKKNLALLLEVNKKSCYVGEPVEVSYRLLSRLQCESKINRQPSFNGFSVIDLPSPGNFMTPTRNYQGKSFNVYTLRLSQAYPLQAGTIEIEPAEIENQVTFVKEDFIRQQGMSDWLDEFALSMLPREALVTRSVVVRNEPVTITVKPLPENGKPAGFDGAVGDFSLETSVEKNRFALNETGLLTIVIKGAGNLTLLTQPTVSWPEGLETFEPKYYEELDKTAVPVTGKKVFRIAFSATKPGEYKIPPIHFSYFDPAAASYREVASDTIRITVDPANPNLVSNHQLNDRKPSFINRIFYHRWWIVVFVAGLVLCGLIIWVWREKKVADRQRAIMPVQDVKTSTEPTDEEEPAENWPADPLAASAACLESESPADFYRILNREFREHVCRVFSLEPLQVNAGDVADTLHRKGLDIVNARRTQSLLQNLEQFIYTPFDGGSEARSLFDEANSLVQNWGKRKS